MKLPSFLQHSRDRFLFCACFILLAVVVVYWSVRSFGFVTWDDGVLIYENPYYVNPKQQSLSHFWAHPYLHLYMPLSYSLWGIVANLTKITNAAGEIGLDPAVFHSVCLALHTANCLLVFLLLRRLLRAFFYSESSRDEAKGSAIEDGAALAGTLLFALHPLQVESVAWVSETKGLLATFFCLAALVFWCRFLDATRETQTRASTTKCWLGATLCFAAALLSKPGSVVLPLVALLIAVAIWRRDIKASFAWLWPWFVLSLALAFAMTRIQPTGVALEPISPAMRLLVASDAMLFYLCKLFVPLGFTINYGRNPEWLMKQPWVWSALLVFPALCAVAWIGRKRRIVPIVFGWIFIVLLPNLGFVPFLFQQYSTVADRYFYFAMVGPAFALAVVLVALDAKERRRAAASVWIVCAVALAGIGFLAQRQVQIWSDNATLYRHAIATNPRDWASLSNLGNVYADNNDYPTAMGFYEKTLAIKPKWSPAYVGLAMTQVRLENPDAALTFYRKALQYDAGLIGARSSFAMLLAERGNKVEALKELKIIIKKTPEDAAPKFYAGQILIEQGDLVGGEKYIRDAIATNDDYALAHLVLGIIYHQRNNKRSALEEYGRALQLDPELSDARVRISQLLASNNLRAQAMNVVQEGLQLAPDDAALRQELARVQALK